MAHQRDPTWRAIGIEPVALDADFGNYPAWTRYIRTLTQHYQCHHLLHTPTAADANADDLHAERNLKTVLRATTLQLLTVEDTDESTAHSIHASITAGAPDLDQRAERRHADALELDLMALGGPAFVQAQRDAHLDVKTISPSHHYATSAAFMSRILHCIRDVPDLTTTHAIYKHANVTSDAEIYRLLEQIQATVPAPSLASSAGAATRPTKRCEYHPHSVTHTTGECRDKPDRGRGRRGGRARGGRGRGGDRANGRGGDGFSEANMAQLIGAMRAAFTSDYSNVNVTPPDEYTPSPRARPAHAKRAIDTGAAGVFLSQADAHLLTSRSASRLRIGTATGQVVRGTQQGPAVLPGVPNPLRVPKATVVPSFPRTLIGASVLARHADIIIQGDKLYVTAKQRPPSPSAIKATGRAEQGVYVMDEPSAIQRACAAVIAAIPTSMEAVHRVFNHAGARRLRHLTAAFPAATRSIRARLDPILGKPNTSCTPCHVGKQTRAPFPRRERTTPVRKMDVISTDTAGPLPPARDTKARYVQAIVDRGTKYQATVAMPSKAATSVAKAINNTIAAWQLATGLKARRYHSDNAREQRVAAITEPLRAQGTEITATTPHSSQQNPDAERAIRTTFDAARAALEQAQMGPDFWADAVADATAKENYLPQTQADGSTAAPITAFLGESGCPAHFLPFGQYGRTSQTKAATPKLAPRSFLVRYLGAPNRHQYKVYTPATGKTTVVRAPEFQPVSTQSALAQAGTRVRANAATTATTDLRVVHPTRRSSLITEAPSSWRDAQRRPDAATWAVAHNREIERHEQVLKTWRLEPPLPKDTPRPFIFTYKAKKDAEGAIHRRTMRCAIRGDLMQASQEYDPARTSAHTPSHTARRLLIAAAAAAGHVIQSWDVPGAYPRAAADPAYRQTMVQPPHFDGSLRRPGQIAVIQQAMQGAPNAGNLWSVHRNKELERWGWKQLRTEASAFVRNLPNGQHARMLADTDDFLVTAPTHEDLARLRQPFATHWQITVKALDAATPCIRHTGLQIRQHDRSFSITNPLLIDELLCSQGMEECNPRQSPHQDGADLLAARDGEQRIAVKPYQSIVGVLRYLADTTMPEISYIAGVLGRHLDQPTKRHAEAIKTVLRYLKGRRDDGLAYAACADGRLLIEGNSDSDYAQDKDTRRSVTGVLLTVNGAPVHWVSCRQRTVTLSSSEAEYTAVSRAARDITWLTALAKDMRIPLANEGAVLRVDDKAYTRHDHANAPVSTPTTAISVDNTGAIAMANAEGPTKRTKHIDVQHHYVQQQVAAGVIKLRQVPTTEQKADFLTKPLPRVAFARACKLAHLAPPRNEGRVGTQEHRRFAGTESVK
jgi:hypothetical protein